ncbi:MAG: hypothetical protein ACI93R_003859 [Flavobacteriales bacterium]|jgi:hypothetical protein
MRYLFFTLLFVFLPHLLAMEITVNPEEINEYSSESGVGCTESSDDKTGLIHIVCKSRESGESAWNACTYRAKLACPSQVYKMHFNKNPTLPTVNGVFGSQMEIKCVENP